MKLIYDSLLLYIGERFVCYICERCSYGMFLWLYVVVWCCGCNPIFLYRMFYRANFGLIQRRSFYMEIFVCLFILFLYIANSILSWDIRSCIFFRYLGYFYCCVYFYICNIFKIFYCIIFVSYYFDFWNIDVRGKLFNVLLLFLC